MTTTTSDVTKFIILSPPRTGTHMLRSTLLEHPEVIVQHELFNPYFGEFHPYTLTESADVILDNFAFIPIYPEVKAIGFPINEHHCTQELGAPWIPVWEKLQRMEDVKVIHLNRENLLSAVISRITAGELKQWNVYDNNKVKDKQKVRIKLEPKTLEHILNRNENRYKYYHGLFKNHDMIEVLYEDQCSHPTREYRRVQEFLDISPLNIMPSTQKQAIYSHADVLVNYEELKQYFQGSRWERFFI